jgi:ribonuclease HI
VHQAAQTIIQATGCSQDQARSAVQALLEDGWSPPDAQTNRAYSGPRDLPATLVGLGPDAVLLANTAGACSPNPGRGGWGVVFSVEGNVVGEFSGSEPHTSNNQIELVAIREALLRAPPDVTIEIATGSKNAIWWVTNVWKRKEPKIAALCQDIDLLRERASAGSLSAVVTFRDIPAPVDDPLSKRAGDLAAAAAVKAQSTSK